MLTETSSPSSLDTAFTGIPYSYSPSSSDSAIAKARTQLLGLQNKEGYWVFELEADCTIPSEYILMMHFMDEIDEIIQAKIANFLRTQQSADGSYPLYKGGAGDISCTIKAYYAMKMAGDAIHAMHMTKAREWILAQGGAAKGNVFTRIMMAMFGQIPWRGVPYMPVEIMLLPKWFPFHLDKVSYWSRTVMVPLFILCTYKVKARNPNKIGIVELFVTPPDQERNYFAHVKTSLGKAILVAERVGRLMEPLIPDSVRRKATAKARVWERFLRAWSTLMKPWIIWASLPIMNSGRSPGQLLIVCWSSKMIWPTANLAFLRYGIPD
jgi:squalene-hopene/tetraprenyl-beta-curcumene cyclase